jgi:hypothetical protein
LGLFFGLFTFIFEDASTRMLTQVYHSAFNSNEQHKMVGNLPILEIKTKTRGVAPQRTFYIN